MADFKPGDVAMVHGRIAMAWVMDGDTRPSWLYIDGDGDACNVWVGPTNARPLVVLDAEDSEQVRRLRVAYYNVLGPLKQSSSTPTQDAMQAALRSLIAPPKPDEPMGLGAVVEDARGDVWVRNAAATWLNLDGGSSHSHYADITAVRVLSEGVAL